MPKKKTTDLSVKHFSRYGEFLASFELSKHGWDNYMPVYDEYIDLLIHKMVCKICGKKWSSNPRLICNKCKMEITSQNKNKIIANGECSNCKSFFLKKNLKNCPKCKSLNVKNIPTCPLCKKGIIEIEEIDCECGSKAHIEKFRTIQVKASRLEKDGRSYAVDLRPKDLTQGSFHAYIWVCIDKDERPHFLVIPIKAFSKYAQNFINSTSFLKDEGREHFSASTFGKWGKFKDRFDLLE